MRFSTVSADVNGTSEVEDYDPTIWDFLHQTSVDDLTGADPVPSSTGTQNHLNHQNQSKTVVELAETIREIVDTEISYGKDLNIIKTVSFLGLWDGVCCVGSCYFAVEHKYRIYT